MGLQKNRCQKFQKWKYKSIGDEILGKRKMEKENYGESWSDATVDKCGQK